MFPRLSYLREYNIVNRTGALIVRGGDVMFEPLERSKPHRAAPGPTREHGLLMTLMGAFPLTFHVFPVTRATGLD